MALRTALTELLGIEHPVILAPMGGVSGGALAASVTRAGGLGLIGPGYSDADWVHAQFEAAGNETVGIGFITWHARREPAQVDAALEHGPRAVMFFFGDAAPFVDRAKRAGTLVIMQIQTLGSAREAAALGADVIVAQGADAEATLARVQTNMR